jgi:hypothetical protein
MSGWSFRKRLIVGIVLAAIVVAGMVVIARVNEPLTKTCTKRVAPLEVTPSVAVAKNIVDDWRAKGALDAARIGTYIDFPFIVAYSAAFWFFCVWAGLALAPHDERWLAYGRAFGRAGVLAGALDFFVENPGLLLEMNGTYNPAVTVVKAIGASVKWLLVLLVFAFLVISFIIWLRIKWDKGKSDPRRMLPA